MIIGDQPVTRIGLKTILNGCKFIQIVHETSRPNANYRLEFFANAACDPSGYGEGERYLGSSEVTTGANGDTSFSVTLSGGTSLGEFVTATATDESGNTSEFSACAAVTEGAIVTFNYHWRYEYNGLNRLTYACSDWDADTASCVGDAFDYSYDGAGNLLNFSRWDEAGSRVETVSFVYNSANQIVCQDGGGNGACGDPDDVMYSYDAYGNLTSDGIKSYTYDAENRLVSVGDGASTTSYTYNGDGDRISQTVDGVTTSYVLDTASPLTMVLAETTGADTIYYLHGLDLVAQNDGAATKYFAYDGLGSVRQMLDSGGSVLFAQVFDPYGNPYTSAGVDSTNWGFTGEMDDSDGLIFLRARYYDPSQGRFLQRDPWQGDVDKPVSYNPWLYVSNNPISYSDPSGLWRWAATSSVYHLLIENHYEGTPGGLLNPSKQLEFRIPRTRRRPDIFKSISGEVYEIEPWYLANSPHHGVAQAAGYVADLLAAGRGGLLTGTYLRTIPYNWNATPFNLGSGLDWPGRYRTVMPGFPMVDLVADYTSTPGLIEYWIEPNAIGLAVIAASLPLIVPNKRLVRPPDWAPGTPAYQPARLLSWQEACGYALVAIGGTIITVTIAEDIATGGIGVLDDAVTIPGGLLFINVGTRLGVPIEIIAP